MNVTHTDSDRYKLVEESAGYGTIKLGDEDLRVHYAVKRFQGMTRAGLPVPGVHRIDGAIRLESGQLPPHVVGRSCELKLEDGRRMRVTLIDHDGRILAEGHGPSRCTCC